LSAKSDHFRWAFDVGLGRVEPDRGDVWWRIVEQSGVKRVFTACQGVKLTGTYRMATPPTMADALPMAGALIEAAPNRLIWGSDYPHVSFADKGGSVQLFNLLADWAPDERRDARSCSTTRRPCSASTNNERNRA
jgi:hypothetical protein